MPEKFTENQEVYGKKSQLVKIDDNRDAMFRSVCECAVDIVCTLDWRGSFTYVNPAWEKLLGHNKEEVLGRYFTDFVLPEDVEMYRSDYKKIRDLREAIVDKTGVILNKDGTPRYFSISAAPHIDVNGQLTGMVGHFRDITQRLEISRELEFQKACAQEFIQNAPEAIVMLDLDDKITCVNREFTRLFSYTEDQAKGRHINDLIVPEELKDEGDMLTSKATKGLRIEVETRRMDRFKKIIHVSILANPIWLNNEMIGIYAIYRDISQRKKAEADLRHSEARHRIFLQSTPDPVIVRDIYHQVVYINPAFTKLFGWTARECGVRQIHFVPAEHLTENISMIEMIKMGNSFSGIETKRFTKFGKIVDVSISGAPLFDSEGNPEGSIVTLQDITERKLKDMELINVEFNDQLTGLPNRKSFYATLDEMINTSCRRCADTFWALMVLDLDKFQHVNDTLGHDVGDELLKKVAGRLNACIRDTDMLFRLGGDEFIIILDSFVRHDIISNLSKVAQKIRQEIARPFMVRKHRIYTSVSIGITVYPEDGLNVESLVKNADMAMYAAKEEQSGYSFFTEDMNTRAVERMRLESDLRTILERDELVLYYQPLVDNHGCIIGAEALLRWDHPELGIVPPVKFIGIAEETGDIVDIGKWVLETACSQAKKWLDQGVDNFFIAVNLSPRQFREVDLVDTVMRSIKKSGIEPRALKLEITESSVMVNPEICIEKMLSLKKEGIVFSIDDFGTGYSSLSYLKRFPITTLKIDRSFVMDAMDNRDDQEIIRSIVAMAKNLEIETVAEGVETEEQSRFLTGLGCNTLQGYYFGKPMAERYFSEILLKQKGKL